MDEILLKLNVTEVCVKSVVTHGTVVPALLTEAAVCTEAAQGCAQLVTDQRPLCIFNEPDLH